MFGHRIFNEPASSNHLEQKEHHSGQAHFRLDKKEKTEYICGTEPVFEAAFVHNTF